MNKVELLFEEFSHLAPATIYKMFKQPERIAKRKRMDIKDLIQYANEGLIIAINTYDENKGKFQTHAINNIKWHVMVKLRDDDNYKRYKSKPNSKENDVKLEYMDNTLKDDGGTLTYHEVIASDVNVFDEACGNVIAPQILAVLTGRQKEALLLRANGHTYKEVGKRLGISKQAVEKLISKANCRISKIKDELKGVI